MIKAIIFDMDGVLIDSPRYGWKFINDILAEEGVHVDNKHIKKYLGMSWRDTLKRLKEDFGVKEYDVDEFSKRVTSMELPFYRKKFKENKNLKKLLKELKNKGIKLAVATSSHIWRAEEILNLLGIKNSFDTIVTIEEIKNHKPNPEIYLKAAQKLGFNPQNCVVVEDAPNGINAGKSAGMKTIALLTKLYTKKDLKDADLIIKSLNELKYEKLKEIIKNDRRK